MKYKLGLKLWSTNIGNYYEEAKRLYRKELFDYIELYVVPGTEETISKWRKIGIPFGIHCPHFAHGFNLAKVEKKESNSKIYMEVKKFADLLDAKYIIFHGGIDGEIEETAKQLASFHEPRALLENKPYVALPNKMGGQFCRGYNFDEVKLVKEISGCGFCLDFGHAVCAANSQNRNHISYIDELMQMKPDMFHLTDLLDVQSPYDSHLHLGKGQLDIEKMLSFISDGNCITVETVKDSKENLDDFAEDMEWLSNIS
jgi:endonuclease IV